MYSGNKAIDYLANQISNGDPGESSHWRKYHSNFLFLGDGFEGLQGFGGSEKPYRGVRLALHRLFQSRFRSMGAEYEKFRVFDRLASKITTRQRRAYDLDVLRQSLTLAFLLDKNALMPQATVCVIGDGFASLTSLLIASDLVDRVVLVNLTKTLLVDLWNLKLYMGEEKFNSSVDLVTDNNGLAHALAKPLSDDSGGRVIAIQAVHHELLKQCPITLALNIVSMQEMDPKVIEAYFDDLRTIAATQELVFYCCNREEKTFPDGTETRFSDYPWHASDRIHVDDLCPWHQQFYALSPPFYRPYDGPIRHRLVTLA